MSSRYECRKCLVRWDGAINNNTDRCPECRSTDVHMHSLGFGRAKPEGWQLVPDAPTAAEILRKGAGHIEDRAASRDCVESGERSMSKTVKAFNALYGHELTEEQGWQFMCILKKARASQGGYNADDYEDDAAYAALAGECAGSQA